MYQCFIQSYISSRMKNQYIYCAHETLYEFQIFRNTCSKYKFFLFLFLNYVLKERIWKNFQCLGKLGNIFFLKKEENLIYSIKTLIHFCNKFRNNYFCFYILIILSSFELLTGLINVFKA